MIVLVNSSEPLIGEHRGDGGQMGGRKMLVTAREEMKEYAHRDAIGYEY